MVLYRMGSGTAQQAPRRADGTAFSIVDSPEARSLRQLCLSRGGGSFRSIEPAKRNPCAMLYNVWRRELLNPLMSDRAFLFLFSLLMIVGGLAFSGYLVATGQALTVDGLFLVLTALLVVAVFALYVIFMINREREALTPPPPPKPAAKPKPAPTAVAE
jgi:hypothetical protein